jgi:hypothetical protein
MVTKEELFRGMNMSIDDELEIKIDYDDLKKYGSIFMKHEQNPVLMQVLAGKTTFRDALKGFYADKPLMRKKKKNELARFDAPTGLISILKEFSEEKDLSSLTEQELSYDHVRAEYQTYEKNQSKDWHQEILLSTLSGIFIGTSLISALLHQYIVTSVSGLAGITLYTINFKRSCHSNDKYPLFYKLSWAASEADLQVQYYKAYKAIKSLEVPR